MFLAEIFNSYEDFEGYQNPDDDQSVIKKPDTRKTRLTLAHINKLRMLNDTRQVEHEQKINQIQQQYKSQGEDAGL